MWFCSDFASFTVLTVIGATFQGYILPQLNLELEEDAKLNLEFNCAKLLESGELATFLPYMARATLLLCGVTIIFFAVSTVSAAIMCLG